MIESRELDRLNRKLADIGEELVNMGVTGGDNTIPGAITGELVRGAVNIRNAILKSMRDTPKTGRHYRRGKKTHVASSPGNPPAIDSGDLIKSVIFDVRPMEIEVGSIISIPPYPRYLEEGTEKMEARPWLGPAVEKHTEEIIDDVMEAASQLMGKPFKGK